MERRICLRAFAVCAVLALGLGGCVQPTVVQDTPVTVTPEVVAPSLDGPIKTLDIAVEYVDDRRQRVGYEYQPRDVILVFPVIPGQIFGDPSGPPVFIEEVASEQRLTLDLARAEPLLEGVARVMRNSRMTRGLHILPNNTRLARIGTFPFDARTEEPLGAGGFIDAATRDYLILMYFDRACHLTGALQLDEAEFRHDIEIPAAGFYWVQGEEYAPGRHLIRRYQPAHGAVFSIHLLELKQI